MNKVYRHNFNNTQGLPLLIPAETLPFDLEPEYFQYTDNIHDADIIVVYGVEYIEKIKKIFDVNLSNKLVLIGQHTHSHDNEAGVSRDASDQLITSNINYKIITTSNPSHHYSDSTIFYNFLFNRQKVYFTEYNKYDLSNRHYSLNATEKMYVLDPILNKPLNAEYKKFLIPNRVLVEREGTIKERNYYRKLLSTEISSVDCFYSDFVASPPIILEPQETGVREIWWAPVANKYYLQSLISVYVESVTNTHEVRVITEKTFDPLIKGHFILPFSYSGIIHDLKTIYGFKFPKWIDYSYDKVSDVDERFRLFIKSMNELRSLDTKLLLSLYNQDIHILKHNRQIFFDRPYDSLYEKLKPFL